MKKILQLLQLTKKIIYAWYLCCLGYLAMGSVFFLSGCEKEAPSSVITIDDYVLRVYTPVPFHQNSNTQELDPVIQKYLLAMYTIEEDKTFDDNILVFKMPNTYQDINDFVTKNTEHITEPRHSENDNKTTTLDDCEKDIPLIVKGSEYEHETTSTYFVQGFFLDGDDAYLISAGTEDKERYDQLYDDMKHLACKNIAE